MTRVGWRLLVAAYLVGFFAVYVGAIALSAVAAYQIADYAPEVIGIAGALAGGAGAWRLLKGPSEAIERRLK
ncbi:MAG TPA: hypothetical protein VNM48_01020 [Chloroflexota bacterium]|nr:hypothetical protein [Chloroflexota bacterium]